MSSQPSSAQLAAQQSLGTIDPTDVPIVAVRELATAHTATRRESLVNQAITPVAELLQARFRKSGRRLELDLSDLGRGWIDPALTQQALLHVLDNSLLAMPEGGVVRITARREADRLIMQLDDDGAAPDTPYDSERLFEPFATDRRPTAGLALVRQFCEAQGGSIAAVSRPEGGIRFIVQLPLAAPHKDH